MWKVELRGDGAADFAGFSATLEDRLHQRVATETLRVDSTFEFRNVPYGDYWITISDARGAVVYQSMVTVRSGGWQEIIQIATRGVKPRPPAGGVSVAELLHPPARKAFDAFLLAQKYSESGRFEEAARQLEKAIRISPSYAEAHSNLAAEEIRLGRFEEAIRESQRAIELGKPNAIDFGNIAYARFRLNRRGEAIASAELGLQAEPRSALLHYLLGTMLAMDRRTLAESIPHLEAAARELPAARQNLEAARKALGR
jgi:tetratricopeptide (TPR) repeat protein